MLRGITGVPGAGKTSFAVSLLLEAYAKKDRPIFTNINLKIPYDDYLRPLDIEQFHEFCENELSFFNEFRKQQSEKRKLDPDNFEPDNYDDLLRNSGVLQNYGNALIFWDECQTDFDKEDKAYLRFCSYHRHFEGMDVYLITQNLSLIHRKYKAALDRVYFAVSSSKRLFSKTFKLKVFADSKMYGRDLIETIAFTPSKEIFASYDSGHDKLDKSVFLKKIAPIIILIILITSVWKFLIVPYVFGGGPDDSSIPATTDQDRVILTPEQSALSDSVKQDQQNNEQYFIDKSNNPDGMLPPPPMVQNGQPIQQSNQMFNNSSSDQTSPSHFLIRFQCTQQYCYFSDNSLTIPLSVLQLFFKRFNAEILTSESFTKDISIFTALVPSELYQMIETHKITSRSDNYGTHSEQTNFGTSMVPNRTTTTGFNSSPGV